MQEKESLEKLQYDAARAVSSLTRSVSIDRLLNEIGWVSLSDRRKMQKLTLVFKKKITCYQNIYQTYFPNSVSDTSPYNLRNNQDYVTVPRDFVW